MPDAPPAPFVHLHLHSQYSLLDGGNRLDRLVKRVKELGMDAVAVTDHGNLFGAVEFYNLAKKQGIKPILGIEAYVAPNDRLDKTYTGVSDGGYHLVLLAENLTGWRNLLKLSSDAFINGFYYKPRMDKSTLEQWSQGLIAINGHLGSSLGEMLLKYDRSRNEADYQQAVEEARWHAQTFGKNENGEPCFYLELQNHDVPEQQAINPHIRRMAEELGLPLVGDNDAHFLLEQDHDVHDTLCCISMGKVKEDTNRLIYSRDLYVKSPEQMVELFIDCEEAIQNSRRIADRCNVDLDFSTSHAPMVRIERKTGESKKGRKTKAKTDGPPVGSTEWFKNFCAGYELLPFDSQAAKVDEDELKNQCDQALAELAGAGAIWRYGENGVTDEIRQRLDRELKILADKNISAYFLIVWDFVNEARRRGIPANARGSGVGTMVGYCLGLSNACPVTYNLLFERFTDPNRSEYPDIDIDICQDGRQEIIEYVRQKYGHVAQIITFGTLKARAAIRDVGRVMDMPLSEVDRICKLVGSGLGTTIESALAQEPELEQLYNDNPMHRKVIDSARQLEGMARHAGVHAAGVVIATQPLDNIIPLYQPSGTEQLVTQWDGPTVEKVGLLKMDFLGLRTLSIIERSRQLIRQSLSDKQIRAAVPGGDNSADPLDLERLTFDDPKVLDLFGRGETAGVFQFESGGMRNVLLGMKPDRFEDLIAANALYRPGPMELIPDYCDRKHGRQQTPRVHPIVDDFTRETYGIMVYQEQVMQIVHSLGDVPLRDAYSLIKAISKKKMDVIDANRPKFVQGAVAKGLTEQQATELFDLILKFAGYGFNKSHSTGYAILAYQTAFLKTYFPIHFMAATLTYEAVSTDKVVEYIGECKHLLLPNGKRGVQVRPPDINLSDVAFTVVYEPKETHDPSLGHIRFGLSAVKGVGEKAIRAIIEARSGKEGLFTSLWDFCERVSNQLVNRSTIEALIKCGAFDSVHGSDQRAALLEALDAAIAAGHRAQADRNAGQMNFFDAMAAPAGESKAAGETQHALPQVPAWTTAQVLAHEKSVLGLFVSSHPLDPHEKTIERFSSCNLATAKKLAADVQVTVGGMLKRVRPTVTRKDSQKMAFLTLEDKQGSLDAVVFPKMYNLVAPLLVTDAVVMLQGTIDRRREEPSLRVDQIIPVEKAATHLTQAVKITLRESGQSEHARGRLENGELENLKKLLQNASGLNGAGVAEVLFQVHQDHVVTVLKLNGLRVDPDASLAQRIDAVVGRPGACEFVGPAKLRPRPPQPRPGDPATPGRVAEVALHDESELPQNRLHREQPSEVCASIDRY